MFVCPEGHMAVRRAKQGAKRSDENQRYAYYFDIEKCKVCNLRQGCYKEGAKSKSYSVSINSKEHEAQIEFQNLDYFKDKSKHRYKIEAKNGELKNTHSFDRAISYGSNNMQMQTALTIFAVNLKRILKPPYASNLLSLDKPNKAQFKPIPDSICKYKQLSTKK